ncbi:PREDICTED: CUE domain-containing protein 1 isoform X2 [Diuraphis noxia]|uniref:CUE domain-containing protein 1 isoform X2 n=1 Tax=Diuraphis noxia TaxID=143948 RepID=UPI00076360CF|nr:PREDICTED: CUE domain-containing protein 1 isoform X2 [Diuraphis noxia]
MEAVDVVAESAKTAADRRPPTVGLDFNEAMADFKTMFPTLDDEVIEAVLRCNKGSVDRTVDQLLTMSCECRAADLLNGPTDGGGLPVQHAVFDPMLPDVLHNLGKKAARQIDGCSSSRWNPPMLGPLPTDFLRLTTTGNLTSQVSESELNDEQIAILLQNEEFLVQLRKNEQFLSTLDKDSPIEEQKFFVPNQIHGDEDAAFKERLKNMGKASRKKFIQIARVFTGKKKKSTARNIMNQGDTHTKDNLFLHEEEH